jgi:CheY-like chemotaxis protein
MTAMLDSRIYIADDEPANVKLLEAVLDRAGFTSIASFADGGALLGAIANQEPDLVLLDLRMPLGGCGAVVGRHGSGALTRTRSPRTRIK